MLKKYFINFLFFIFIFVSLCTTICYASVVPITDENLSEAIKKFISTQENKDNYNISVSNNIINITKDNESYTLDYDLTDKPTFSMEISIEKGMSYDDFKEQTSNLNLPLLGYIAVANIQGVEIKDATEYLLFSYFKNGVNGSLSSDDSYLIVDDLNRSEDVKIENTDNSNIIYTSEFGDRVIEYVNSLYEDKQSIVDSTGINSYIFTTEKKSITDTTCKLISTLNVNLDADFSKLNGYSDEIENLFLNSDITKENADYAITLKVGQKCKIESNESVTSHELFGYDCIEFNEDYTEIVATRAGTSNGYLYVGNTKKSIYITVEENTENENLDIITLKIENSTTNNKENSNNIADIDVLPRTGEEKNLILIVLYILVGSCSLGLITLLYITKRKKD